MGNGEGNKPVRVVQFLLLAFEYNNLFPEPIDSWPMGTVSLPKYRLDSVQRVSETALDTPHTKTGSPRLLKDVQAERTSDQDGSGSGQTDFIKDLLDMQVWPNILLSKIRCCSCLLYFSFLL